MIRPPPTSPLSPPTPLSRPPENPPLSRSARITRDWRVSPRPATFSPRPTVGSEGGMANDAGGRMKVVIYYAVWGSEEHTSELQSQSNLVCRLLLGKKKEIQIVTKSIDAVESIAHEEHGMSKKAELVFMLRTPGSHPR